MIGMNAHINFDLGIAAAQMVEKGQMQALEPDFSRINKLLSELVDEVKNELPETWPLFKWLDRFAGSLDGAWLIELSALHGTGPGTSRWIMPMPTVRNQLHIRWIKKHAFYR